MGVAGAAGDGGGNDRPKRRREGGGGDYLGAALDSIQGMMLLRQALVCFAAGTPLRTPEGQKAIERFRPGDRVLSRPEDAPEGPVEARVVEEVFVRTGRIIGLQVGGRVIRTTREHPFYARDKGWLPAGELGPGDQLLGLGGRWVAVEDLLDTGTFETVYNLRVADFHTYFVGCDEWGFSVWAHNAYVYHYGAPDLTVLAPGTWVTYSDGLPFDEAFLITNYHGDTMSQYEFDESLGNINWEPWPVNGKLQGRTTVAVDVPPAVETPVYRKP